MRVGITSLAFAALLAGRLLAVPSNPFEVTNSAASHYSIDGENDPILNLVRGGTYTFNINAPNHPFWIKTAQTTGTGNAYDTGVTGNGTEVGTLTFIVPVDAPDTLFYICEIHVAMTGQINVTGPPFPLTFRELKKLRASDAQAGDDFGYAVSLDGDTIVVGAVGEDGGAGDPLSSSGAAYVFERNLGEANNWGEATILAPSDAQADDKLGRAVSLDGDTLVVGAVGEDGGPGDPLSFSGAAYVFERNLGGANNWGVAATLRASDAQSGDTFGSSVSLDGNTIAAGAPAVSNFVGAAYIYDRDQPGSSNWVEIARLRASDGSNDISFAESLALAGDTLVVGAPYAPGPGDEFFAGAAYVFDRNFGGLSNWGEVTKLISPIPDYDQNFGKSAAISGDTIVIGAPGALGGFFDTPGTAYVFERNIGGPNNWGLSKILRSLDLDAKDQFGWSVAISGNTVLVGAPEEAGGFGDPASNRGAIYVFERNQGGPNQWGQIRKLSATDGGINDFFGISLAIDGDTALAGAYGDNNDAGSAYVFDRSSDALEPDDTFLTAHSAQIGGDGNVDAQETHNFDEPGDEDWIRLYLVPEYIVTVEASPVGQGANPVLDVFKLGSTGELIPFVNRVGEDKAPGGYGSFAGNIVINADTNIVTFSDASGTYFVKVTNSDPSVSGPGAQYSLQVASETEIQTTLAVVVVDMLSPDGALPPADTFIQIDENDPVSLSGTNVYIVSPIAPGVHTVSVSVASNYLGDEDPEFPGEVANPYNVLFGNPKRVTVVENQLNFAAFVFFPAVHVEAQLRDAQTGGWLENVPLGFESTSGVLSGLVYTQYPAYALWAQPWITGDAGIFPADVILPDGDWDLAVGNALYGEIVFSNFLSEAGPPLVEAGPLPLLASDSDGDGIPDWWESEYFGTNGAAADSDPDGDLYNNELEFLLGTVPTNSESRLAADLTLGAVGNVSTSQVMDHLTEEFIDNDFDLPGQSVWFLPNGSEAGYSVCNAAASSFPVDPSTGNEIFMGIDDFLAVNLENGQDFVFFGSAYTNFFIGSNGYITFGDGDTTFDPALMNHFALPRISGFFHDFDVTKGGRVSWEQLEDRAVVTFENVQEFASTNDCSYQYELFFEGEIRLTYPASRLSNGIMGLSSGPGEVPVDFTESDLSSYGACGEGVLLRWPVIPGRAYVVEAGSAVSNLSTVYGPVTAEVGRASMQWSEGGTATGATNRFYRIGIRLP